jgi:hypothetical protein
MLTTKRKVCYNNLMKTTNQLDYDVYDLEESDKEKAYWEDAYKEIEKHNEEFRKKFPNHCKDCGGWGLHAYTQSHPYGMTYASEELVDPCECTESGKCPRCGHEDALGEEGEGPCPNCQWNYDDGIQTL